MRFKLRFTALDSAFLFAAVVGGIGVCLPFGLAFCAPLLLVTALAFSHARRAFLPVAFVSSLGIASGFAVHAEVAVLVIAFFCVTGFTAFQFFVAKRRTPTPFVFEKPRKPESSDIDLAGSVGDSLADTTHLFPLAIVERLASSGKFSEEQLEILRTESVGVRVELSGADSSCSFIDMPTGTRVAGYEIDAAIGKGGSGQVYAATPVDGGDSIAIKLLRNMHTTDRFLREMDLVQQLAHPNVVVAYEVGTHLDTPFIAMEKLAGPDLRQHVVESGPLPWEQALDVIVQAARGLEHAHRRGLIHRDVKPANLIWDHGRVKIADLGLAVVMNADGTQDDEPIRNSVAGTPDYMAPEQARGLGNATEAADVYSLAATWYFLLTGRSRVKGDSLRSKMACVFAGNDFHELPANALPESLCGIWEKMITYSPDERYQSMASVIDAIEQVGLVQSLTAEKNSVEVLVVEDDEDDLFLTVEMVKRSNKSVGIVTAHSMREATEACEKFSDIDLVLLDLRLPDSAGVETVERMKAVVPDVPIVVLTGQNDVALGQACIKAGAEEFACKNDLNAHLMERMIFITLSRFHHRNPLLTPRSKASDVT